MRRKIGFGSIKIGGKCHYLADAKRLRISKNFNLFNVI
jgi:hypothetical protein